MAILANLTEQTLAVVARYPKQYLIFGGMLYYPDHHSVIRVTGTGYVHTSPESYWDVLTIVDGAYDGPPFSGRTPWHQWDGADDASTSSNIRHAKLLSVSDELSADAEEFQCLVRTKIFNFEEPSKYKKLFWWGIDAIFRQTVRGTVIPIAYGGQVTWGDVHMRTWGDLLRGTWGQPTSKGLSVETLRPDIGSSAQRKFAKFSKKLPFRQLQFELTFDTDGSSSTAPVRLFSIHSEITQSQTVSKSIT